MSEGVQKERKVRALLSCKGCQGTGKGGENKNKNPNEIKNYLGRGRSEVLRT